MSDKMSNDRGMLGVQKYRQLVTFCEMILTLSNHSAN